MVWYNKFCEKNFTNLQVLELIMTPFKISILVAAFLSFSLSTGLWFSGVENAKDCGLFVGLWVPSFLSLGNLLLKNSKGD
jgi:hypothetical protein